VIVKLVDTMISLLNSILPHRDRMPLS